MLGGQKSQAKLLIGAERSSWSELGPITVAGGLGGGGAPAGAKSCKGISWKEEGAEVPSEQGVQG